MKHTGLPLRIHLLLVSIFAFILPVIIAGTVLYVQITNQLDQNVRQNLQEQSGLISLIVEQDYYEALKKSMAGNGSMEYFSQMYQANLLEYLEQVKVGENGYVFILDKHGNYVLSDGRERDGESIINSQDQSGRYFIKDMLEEAHQLDSGETSVMQYPWRNSKSDPLQEKLAVYSYFEEWDWVIGVSAVMEDYQAGTVFIRRLTMILGFAFILIAIFMAVLMGRAYAGPIERLEHVIRDIGAGDLTRRVAIKSSIREFNYLSHDFDTNLIEKLRQMLAGIQAMVHFSQDNSEEISNQVEGTLIFTNQMAEELGTMRSQMYSLDNRINEASSAAEQIDATIKSVGTQIENQSSSVTETSAAIEEMNSSIQSVARITEDRQQAGEELAQITGEGGKKVSQTNDIIQEIGVSIQDMQEMITVINKVAAQTNLLAMNAAIEAAHAGDAGRGFAVVADEIRNLSTSTSGSAKQISGRLKEIVGRIQQATEISAETGRTFEDVDREVRSFVEAFGEIAASAGELSSGSEEMLNAVSTLQNVTHEIQSGSDEMTSGVGDISKTLQSLRTFSRDTMSHLAELTDKTQNVNFAQGNMTDIVIRNTENASKLADETRQFKIAEQSGDGGEEAGAQADTEKRSVHTQFTIGALVLQEWIVRILNWINDENRSELPPDLTKTWLSQWIETTSKSDLADYDNFIAFCEHYKRLVSLTEELQASFSEGSEGSEGAKGSEEGVEQAEQIYEQILSALKLAKSSIRSLGYDLSDN
ncbi:MAG: methyl-accepting chemotaxis protein [Spirochaetia bacterium]